MWYVNACFVLIVADSVFPYIRFATIASMQKGHDSDSSDEEGQAYYAGGSERGA